MDYYSDAHQNEPNPWLQEGDNSQRTMDDYFDAPQNDPYLCLREGGNLPPVYV